MEQIAEEADWLKDSLDKYFMRNQRLIKEAQERAELLGRAVSIIHVSFFVYLLCILCQVSWDNQWSAYLRIEW